MEQLLQELDDQGLLVVNDDGSVALTEKGLASLHIQLALLAKAAPRHVARPARRLARELVALAESHDEEDGQ